MLSNQLAAFSTNYGVSQTARPSVSAGGVLVLNIILSPVPKPYLSHSRFSTNVSRNNDQFSLQTQKANFSISLGFLRLIRTVSFLLTSDSLDFRLHICILNTASLFYVCMFFCRLHSDNLAWLEMFKTISAAKERRQLCLFPPS